MKSFGTYQPPETQGLQFHRLATPHGRELPRAPIPGELFTLEVDMPEPQNASPWYLKGTYVFSGSVWVKLSDGVRRRAAGALGAQKIEVEKPGQIVDTPLLSSGYALSAMAIVPSNQRASLSGAASVWVDLSADGYVWLMVFRGTKLVGITAQFVEAGKPSTMSLTFLDMPASSRSQVYSLKIDTDAVTKPPEGMFKFSPVDPAFLYVNQCSKFNFDGGSQTAFIIEENV